MPVPSTTNSSMRSATSAPNRRPPPAAPATKSTNSWTTVPPILTMASHTDPVTWSYLPTPMLSISMPANLAQRSAHTSCVLKMTLSLPTTDLSSPSHKSSNLSRPPLQNPNLPLSSFAPKKWSLSGSPSLKWDGHNPSHPSKPITPLPWVLPTKPS
eukprot:CCRYP_014754-RH/>CCRYP_014754-RH protein AED:0.43 eAED:0.43 QI:0/-1/0/1/-1/0/1/0/155